MENSLYSLGSWRIRVHAAGKTRTVLPAMLMYILNTAWLIQLRKI